jgi:hypothetical protein
MRSDKNASLLSQSETLGKIAPAIAHDINNLLSGILGYSQIIISDSSAGDLKSYAEEIEKASKRISNLIRLLQVFNPRQSFHEELVDINGIFQELEKYIPHILGEDISFFIQKAPKLRLIRADKTRIRQVFLLWLCILRDLLPQGGRIRVEVENCVSAMEAQVSCKLEIVIRANIVSPIPFPQSLAYPSGITEEIKDCRLKAEDSTLDFEALLPLCGGRTTCTHTNETALSVLIFFPAELPISPISID